MMYKILKFKFEFFNDFKQNLIFCYFVHVSYILKKLKCYKNKYKITKYNFLCYNYSFYVAQYDKV